MKIKLTAAIALFALTQITFAQTCPTVQDIKLKSLAEWKAFDSDDNSPLSKDREAKFKKGVEEFALAEWRQKDAKNGTVHCYYRDKSGSDLEAYLANENLIPLKEHSYWYSVTGFMHCAAGMDKCQFKHTTQPTQFAKTETAKHEG